MPQLAKGGKWVFGWSVVGQGRELSIPPEAWLEYGFRNQEVVLFTRGSQRSGGFGIGKRDKLLSSPIQTRVLAQAIVHKQGKVLLPQNVEANPGDRLLVVRGSGLALGFLARGPIYEEALKHPELETFYT
jgi:hypothetical protein